MKFAASFAGLAFLLSGFLAAQEVSEASTPPGLIARDDIFDETPREPDGTLTPSFEEEVVELVNFERAACGDAGCPKPPLKFQPSLFDAADEHSDSMGVNDYFSHRDFADGCNTVGTRMTNAGYTGWTNAAENIAAGYNTPNEVMYGTMSSPGWMDSSGHKANILSSSYREIGVGFLSQVGDAATVDYDCNTNCTCTDVNVCGGITETCSEGPYVEYWTQVFGARGGSTGYPVIIASEQFDVDDPAVDLYVYQTPGTGAQMQFANETGEFSTLEAFATAKSWNLTPGDGRKSVIAIVTTSSGTFRTCDRIWLDGSGDSSFVFGEGFECDGLSGWDSVAQ